MPFLGFFKSWLTWGYARGRFRMLGRIVDLKMEADTRYRSQPGPVAELWDGWITHWILFRSQLGNGVDLNFDISVVCSTTRQILKSHPKPIPSDPVTKHISVHLLWKWLACWYFFTRYKNTFVADKQFDYERRYVMLCCVVLCVCVCVNPSGFYSNVHRWSESSFESLHGYSWVSGDRAS